MSRYIVTLRSVVPEAEIDADRAKTDEIEWIQAN